MFNNKTLKETDQLLKFYLFFLLINAPVPKNQIFVMVDSSKKMQQKHNLSANVAFFVIAYVLN